MALSLGLAFSLVLLVAPTRAAAQEAPPKPSGNEPAARTNLTITRLNVHDFRVVERESGRFSYYKIVEDPVEPFLRAVYRPPLETVVVGLDIGDDLRNSSKRLRWKWRAMALPKNADECRPGYGDSAATVYVAWRRFLKIYSLKFVWSTLGRKGQVCQTDNNLFLERTTVVLESGGPIGTWINEEIDLAAEFREHFAHGDPDADIPDFLGIGVMSDGDQTRSVSEGDYTNFAILH